MKSCGESQDNSFEAFVAKCYFRQQFITFDSNASIINAIQVRFILAMLLLIIITCCVYHTNTVTQPAIASINESISLVFCCIKHS